jgi:peptide/nickel transport system ATP-binding protein
VSELRRKLSRDDHEAAVSAIEIEAVPTGTRDSADILRVGDLRIWYAGAKGPVQAVDGVSFALRPGEVLGLVGESGCGKSTLGRAVLQLRRPTAGRVAFDGTELTELDGEAMRLMRRRLQTALRLWDDAEPSLEI